MQLTYAFDATRTRNLTDRARSIQQKETILGTGFLTYNPTLANCIFCEIVV